MLQLCNTPHGCGNILTFLASKLPAGINVLADEPKSERVTISLPVSIVAGAVSLAGVGGLGVATVSDVSEQLTAIEAKLDVTQAQLTELRFSAQLIDGNDGKLPRLAATVEKQGEQLGRLWEAIRELQQRGRAP